MDQFAQTLFTITQYCILLPVLVVVIVFFINAKRRKGVSKDNNLSASFFVPISLYVAVQLVGEITANITHGENNLRFLLIYSIAELIILSGIYWKTATFRRAIPWTLAISGMVFLAEGLVNYSISITFPVARTLVYIWFSVLTARYIHGQLADMSVYDIFKIPMVIISSGLLIYFLTTVFFVSMENVYMSYPDHVIIEIFKIKWIISILSRVFISVGIWMMRLKLNN